MKNLFIGLLCLAAVVWAFRFIGESKKTAFTSDWTITTESDVAGNRSERKIRLVTDGHRFRLESEERDVAGAEPSKPVSTTQVFDGKHIHTRTVVPPWDGAPPMEPITDSIEPTTMALQQERFWIKEPRGDKAPGGLVAGRDTVLVQVKEGRSDAKFSGQWWTDAKTGILLKSIESLYAIQVESVLNKTTVECRSITYGPVPDTSFQKP